MNTENDLRSTAQLMEQRFSAAVESQLHKNWQADKKRWQGHFHAAQREYSIPLQSESQFLPENMRAQATTSALRPQQSSHSESSNIVSHAKSSEVEAFFQERELPAPMHDRGRQLPSTASSFGNGYLTRLQVPPGVASGYTQPFGAGGNGNNPSTNDSYTSERVEHVILNVMCGREQHKSNVAFLVTAQNTEASPASAEGLTIEPDKNIFTAEVVAPECGLQVRIFENAADVAIIDRFFVHHEPEMLLRRLQSALRSQGIRLGHLVVNGQTLFSRTNPFEYPRAAPLMIA